MSGQGWEGLGDGVGLVYLTVPLTPQLSSLFWFCKYPGVAEIPALATQWTLIVTPPLQVC